MTLRSSRISFVLRLPLCRLESRECPSLIGWRATPLPSWRLSDWWVAATSLGDEGVFRGGPQGGPPVGGVMGRAGRTAGRQFSHRDFFHFQLTILGHSHSRRYTPPTAASARPPSARRASARARSLPPPSPRQRAADALGCRRRTPKNLAGRTRRLMDLRNTYKKTEPVTGLGRGRELWWVWGRVLSARCRYNTVNAGPGLCLPQ